MKTQTERRKLLPTEKHSRQLLFDPVQVESHSSVHWGINWCAILSVADNSNGVFTIVVVPVQTAAGVSLTRISSWRCKVKLIDETCGNKFYLWWKRKFYRRWCRHKICCRSSCQEQSAMFFWGWPILARRTPSPPNQELKNHFNLRWHKIKMFLIYRLTDIHRNTFRSHCSCKASTLGQLFVSIWSH